MTALHSYNRHLYISDNYKLLQSLPSESIDLITTDPPFAKNGTFVGSLKPPLTDDEIAGELAMLKSWGITGPADAEKAGVEWPTGKETAKFKDIWSFEKDVHESWMVMIADEWPAVREVIEAAQYAHSEGVAAYICYMAVRLIECQRVLKPTGSLFLHCDHSANSYVRSLLDAVFGYKNFCNEIIWCYTGPSAAKRYFPRKHDTIFFYSKSEEYHFNPDAVRRPYKATYTAARGVHADKSKDDTAKKRAAHERGTVPTSWWADGQLSNISAYRKELTGYPTQKPWALAERIIKAASNPGDIVLDPFAGCAYTACAAEDLGRQWVACDISPRALTVLRRQFNKKGWAIGGEAATEEDGQSMLGFVDVQVKGPHEIAERDTAADPVPSVKPLPDRKFKVPASLIPKQEMLEFLLGLSGWRAWCCGFANIRVAADGAAEVVETARNFHLDHVDPKSKQGSDQIVNRAPLCPYHNTAKNAERIHLEDLRDRIEKAGEMMVDRSELVDLAYAYQESLDYYARSKPAELPLGIG